MKGKKSVLLSISKKEKFYIKIEWINFSTRTLRESLFPWKKRENFWKLKKEFDKGNETKSDVESSGIIWVAIENKFEEANNWVEKGSDKYS